MKNFTRGYKIAVPGNAPRTLAELLALVNRKDGTQEGMLYAVAARFVEYAQSTADRVSLESLHAEKESFISHLKTGKYKMSSVKSYRNYFNVLLRLAEEAGWIRPKIDIPSDWQAVLDATDQVTATRHSVIKLIVSFAARIGKTPVNFSEDDLTKWRQERVKSGRSQQNAEGDCSRFRTAIVRAGVSAEVPRVKPRDERYGVALPDMHPTLCREIEDLLEWKQSEFEIDRPSEARIRPISAKRLSDLFSQLTGYVQNVADKPEITNLADLVTREHVAKFTTWAKNTRKVKGQSLSTGLGMVFAALRHHPTYKSLDLGWFESIIDQLPMDPQSVVDQRKVKKYIAYDKAEQIPMLIRAERAKMKSPNARKIAISVRNELLMLWLVILPWRQKNIRDCRIIDSNPNLFKAQVGPFCMATKSAWVAEHEKVLPEALFWQVRFSAEETKTKNEVHTFLPSDLVSLLEEYLSVHRPVLVGHSEDPGTLLVNRKGRVMTLHQMSHLVKKLAARHTGVPVTPHLYRDIVAYEWLKSHPEDYLTVSKLLWHRNISTTLRIYGRRFDESTGVARMDDWRASRIKAAA